MKPVRFHAEAKAEVAQETVYYREISTALAARFVRAIEHAVAIASEFPAMGSPYQHGTRRVFARRFPFSVVYLDRPDEVLVVAVAHFSRKPGYWKSRSSHGSRS